MARAFNTDICVIGAGPGGCAIAKRLAELGHAVTLVEAQAFPRPHVGICLSDETYSLLDYLGVGEEIRNTGFLRRKTTVVSWDSEEPRITPQPGIHVDRGVFDSILLENARITGVQILQPARVAGLKQIPEGGWQLRIDAEDKSNVFTTRFLVDASGKSNVFPSKKVKAGPSLFALHADWELEKRPDYDGFIEAGTDAWLWFALTGEHRCLISLFTDPKHFSQSKSESLETHYTEMMNQFSLMNYARLGKRVSKVIGCDASSRYSSDPIGWDYIRVGDANFSVDPMASQGVHLALSTGVQAAVVVNSLLCYPEHREAALTFYKARQMERVTTFTEKSQEVYRQVAKRRPESFWQDRAGTAESLSRPVEKRVAQLQEPSQKIQLSSLAEIMPTPIMRAEYIENAPTLFHPSLSRPVAFLGGHDLVKLIRHIQPGKSLENLKAEWLPEIPPDVGSKILHWLWEREIVVPYHEVKMVGRNKILQSIQKIKST